ncbi:MAG TPA: hypothetical protein VGT41_02370 [Candidatus Babeliales bacterium]|nr:hypothetical protein [Candidatus Babeliales bacterium]
MRSENMKAPLADIYTIAPATLWVGSHEAAMEQLIVYLQTVFCVHKGCGVCHICLQINDQQHHSITWLAPEKQYTLEQIDLIFKTIVFALGDGQHHFFVIQKADFLTPACANRLLKSMEEPPAGYHFILLAERQEQLLPTVRSRCIIRLLQSTTSETVYQPLLVSFTQIGVERAAEFLKLIDQSKINERETLQLLDQLLAYWLERSKDGLIAKDKKQYDYAQRMLTVLKNGYALLPMAGGSKIFWKNLYMHCLG